MSRHSDVFTQLPLRWDDTTNLVSTAHADSSVADLLSELNDLRRALKGIPDNIPPPPMPVSPQRSAAIEKMRTSGNQAFRKGSFLEAVNMYSHAISMARTRPTWEPAPLLKEELQVLYNNRAQAYLSMNSYPEAVADASVSIDFKRMQNHKAHFRKAKALKEMGRYEEAKDALEFGLQFGDDAELQALLREVNASLPAQ